MKKKRSMKLSFFGMIILLLLLVPLTAIAETKTTGTPAAEYALSGTLKAEVKSVSNERVSEGRRIGIVVRLLNQASQVVRIPDYEVRVIASDGIYYSLRPSASNPTIIQPKEKVEMSYMVVVRRAEEFALSKLAWVKVDKTVYPRKEKTMLSIGLPSALVRPVSWRQPFSFATLSHSVVFTPVGAIDQSLPSGPAVVIVIQAENKGKSSAIVPDFLLNGKVNNKVYAGKKIEQDELWLEPGEKQAIHFSIALDKNARLTGMDVLTPERFAAGGPADIQYQVKRFHIALPAGIGGALSFFQLPLYAANKPILFEPDNRLIDPDFEVAVAGLHSYEAEGDAFTTIIAKFKLINRGVHPLPSPAFAAQLISRSGRQYQGVRLGGAADLLAPNLNYVVNYAFYIPDSESGDQLGFRLLDGQSIAPYQIPVAHFKTSVQADSGAEGMFDLYPFHMKIAGWNVTAEELKLQAEVSREDNMIVDGGFSELAVELADKDDKVIATLHVPFVGPGRLTNGWQSFELDLEAGRSPKSVQIYEVIKTPNGEVRRFVQKLM